MISRSFNTLIDIIDIRQRYCNIDIKKIECIGPKESLDIEKVKSSIKLHLKIQGRPVMCIWTSGIKLGANIQDIITTYTDVKHFILVVESVVTSDCKKTISNLVKIGYKIELFTIKELQYNIFDSQLVPVYRRIDKDEKEKLLATYGIKPINMTKLASSDVIVRYLGLDKGDVVCITRASDTLLGKEAIEYKIVG